MKYFPKLFSIAILILTTSTPAWTTDVTVHAERDIISNTQLSIKIYARITPDSQGNLVSAGVKLTYDCNSSLTYINAIKNDTDWYFGTPTDKHSYIDPVHTPPTGVTICQNGQVTFLLGKLDQNAPLAGVAGQKILLGTALFSYSGTAPDTNAFTITDGHDGAFVDFATTGGNDLDNSVTYSGTTVDGSKKNFLLLFIPALIEGS